MLLVWEGFTDLHMQQYLLMVYINLILNALPPHISATENNPFLESMRIKEA